MHRVIIVGSPRPDGRSAFLADELFNACIEECPEDGVSIVSVASTEVAPCMGCEACAQALEEAPDDIAEGDPLEPCALIAQSDAALHQCVIDDDMPEVRKHLDAADELIVVSPVYFAGAPAQLKALLDRMQPYFHSTARRGEKRPLVLHVVGEGGDPHGFEPLIGVVRSAFAVAGFELELVLDWVGKIDEDGEIIAEAEEYPAMPAGASVAYWADEDEVEDGFEVVESDKADDFGAFDNESADAQTFAQDDVAAYDEEPVTIADAMQHDAEDEDADDFAALSFVGGAPRTRADRSSAPKGEGEAARAKLSLKSASVSVSSGGSSGASDKARGASSQGKQANRNGAGKNSGGGKPQGKAGSSSRNGAGKNGASSRKSSGASGAKPAARKQQNRASGGNGGAGKSRSSKGSRPASGAKSAQGGKGGKRRG